MALSTASDDYMMLHVAETELRGAESARCDYSQLYRVLTGNVDVER